jgi:hypothetical protein
VRDGEIVLKDNSDFGQQDQGNADPTVDFEITSFLFDCFH